MSVFSVTKTFRADVASTFFQSFPVASHGLLVYVYLGSSAVFLMLLSLFFKRATRFFDSKAAVLTAGILSFLGTVLILLGSGFGNTVVIIAALLMGIGGSMFVILLGMTYAGFSFTTAAINASLSVAVGFICAVAFVNWIPSPISGIIAALMPLFLIAAFIKRPQAERTELGQPVQFSNARSYMLRFVACTLLFGFVVGTLRVVCADRLLSSTGITVQLVLAGGCFISVMAFVFAIIASKRETYWDTLFRYLSPPIVLGIVCIVALVGDFNLVAAFFVSLGFVCLAALLWVFLSSLARNMNGNAVFVFGLGYGLIQAASVVGAVFANSHIGLTGAEGIKMQPDLTVLALVLVTVYSTGYALLPRYREMSAVFASVLSGMLKNAAVAAEASEGAGDMANAPADEIGDAFVLDIEAAEEEAVDGDDSDEAPQRDEKGSFVRRCEEISSLYQLSAREREVFFLLAKGHNAAFITDQLCISKSTAKTHINHIYKKLDIHTQQELLTMVENRRRGPIGTEVDRETLREAVRLAKEAGPLDSDPSQLVEHIQRDYMRR